jgi:hypothetical protein
MVQLFVVITLVTASQESPSNKELMQKKYGQRVLVNSILCFACTISTGVFYVKGNNAYEDYKSSHSMRTAVEAWDRVRMNDTVRNVFAVGAVFFLTRAVYYQIKRVRLEKSSAVSPVIEVRYAAQPKLLIGLQKDL